MKKLFILSILFGLLSFSTVSAIQTKTSDYEIVNEASQQYKIDNADVISENGNVKIIRFEDKIGIFDTSKDKFIIQPILDTVNQIPNSNDEYIIKTKKLIGFVNISTGLNFLTNYENILPLNNYLKTKIDGKYGLMDKKGNIILQPVFQNISIINSDNKEYIAGKYEGKYRMFYNTGNIIPDEELYTVSHDKFYALANDLKPIFKTSKLNNITLYEKAEFDDNNTYEIKEIKLPEKVKVSDIQNKANSTLKKEKNTLTIDKKEYIVVENDCLVGLNTKNGKEIIPPIYDKIDVKRPCKHFSKQVILANKNGNHTIYDLKGNILAEEINGKVNLYKYGKLYTYENIDNIWELKKGKKVLGNLTVIEDNKYEFTKAGFHIRSLHKLNELLLTILSD